jgi:hypothetical protein
LLTDIKMSVIEVVRPRLKIIRPENFLPDPPLGEQGRPCAYLEFKSKKNFFGWHIGTLEYDYVFDFVVEVEGSDSAQRPKTLPIREKSRLIERAFLIGEGFLLYHFDDNLRKTLREGIMRVQGWRILEGKKDRLKNSITGELIIRL